MSAKDQLAALKPARPLQTLRASRDTKDASKSKGKLDGPSGGKGVQLRAAPSARSSAAPKAPGLATPGAVQATAQSGFSGSPGALPYLAAIQQSFGGYDVSGVKSFVGGAAADANEDLGANAYASGEAVAFKAAPSLHTAAHEAAHVVQQRAGVSLPGGLGRPGDTYERHADRVADDVASGRSAVQTLSELAPASRASADTAPVQRKGEVVQREAVTADAIESLLAGRLQVKTVEGSGSTVTGTGVLVGMGPFGAARFSATHDDSGLSVELTTEPGEGKGFSSATVKLQASQAAGALAQVTADLTVDTLRPLKSFTVTFKGTLDLTTGVAELATANKLVPLLEIVGGLGAGHALFDKLRFDPGTGSLDAEQLMVVMRLPGFEEIKSSAGRIEAGATYADVDFRTTTVYIPRRERPLVESKAGGHATLTAGEWSETVVGGRAAVRFPGVDTKASIDWQAQIPKEGGPVFSLKLAEPWAVASSVTIGNAELLVDGDRKVTATGVGAVSLSFLKPGTRVEMAFDSESGKVRVVVPQAILDYPALAKVKARGEVTDLVLDLTSRTFNSEGKATFGAELPFLGAINGDLEVRANRLATGLITSRKELGIPTGSPLLTGVVNGALRLADNKFESGDLVADLALNLGGTRNPDLVKVVAHVSDVGDVTAEATLATNRPLGKHVVFKGGALR